MKRFKKGNTVLITKGVWTGSVGEFFSYVSGNGVLIQLVNCGKALLLDIDSVMLFCSHNEDEKKEVEFKLNDRVVVKGANDGIEYTVICMLTKKEAVVLDPLGHAFVASVDSLEFVGQQEIRIDASKVFDSVSVSLVKYYERLNDYITCEVDKQIEGLGYDSWATTVVNVGVDQYVESLFSKYIRK